MTWRYLRTLSAWHVVAPSGHAYRLRRTCQGRGGLGYRWRLSELDGWLVWEGPLRVVVRSTPPRRAVERAIERWERRRVLAGGEQ